MVDIYVGEAIRRARVEAGLSQTGLATAVGTSFQQLQKYERGDNRISASRLFALCAALNIEIGSVFPPMPKTAEVVPFEGAKRPYRPLEHVIKGLSGADRKVVLSVASALARKDAAVRSAA
jgi:transcriptional regulator with XRE-family HTH domain